MSSMSAQAKTGGCWPTRQQELLIKAAILDGHQAEANWDAWSATASIDDVEWSSFHLLPLVYSNLSRRGTVMRDADRLKGTYRYTWYRNNRVLQEASAFLQAFRDADIDTLVIKDVALATQYYADLGRRPIDGIHVLVPLQRVQQAVTVLEEMGYRARLRPTERSMAIGSSVQIEGKVERPFTLHWRIGSSSDQTEEFWRAAVQRDIGRVETQIPSPADQLLDVCAHGVRWDVVPPTLWVVDAFTVLSSAGTNLDWDRLTALAVKARATLAMRESLGYLQDVFGANVPEEVLRALQSTSLSRGERAEYAARTSTPRLWNKARAHWYRYDKLTHGQRPWRKAAGFPEYLQVVWELEHVWQVLPVAGRLGTQQFSPVSRGKPEE